ncbi:PREDICTED: uncharacterized protein LOC103603875 isoform X2 [Galeopterus variegatus]|uniref:Uncharacterized protein LOC103603875 isoform X2 n=1 Tax=Galeopterus variegatus TaxID=482537 RepID=A0ABM0S1D6_GALVR|nr:PREDICTED: uncharacterized protein LOC103603875 isoform X2 [Galeopterus variegatus]
MLTHSARPQEKPRAAVQCVKTASLVSLCPATLHIVFAPESRIWPLSQTSLYPFPVLSLCWAAPVWGLAVSLSTRPASHGTTLRIVFLFCFSDTLSGQEEAASQSTCRHRRPLGLHWLGVVPNTQIVEEQSLSLPAFPPSASPVSLHRQKYFNREPSENYDILPSQSPELPFLPQKGLLCLQKLKAVPKATSFPRAMVYIFPSILISKLTNAADGWTNIA